MKHQFLITCISSHTLDHVHQTLAGRFGNFIGDFAPATIDIFPGTAFAPPQPPPSRTVPEAVRKLARQLLLYTGVRPVMVTVYEDHYKAHDEGGELLPVEHYTDQQVQHLVSLFRDVAGATMGLELPHTFHLEQVISDDELDMLGSLQGYLNDLQKSDISLLHEGTFDPAQALLALINEALGGHKP